MWGPRLRSVLRDSDFAGRNGGEEFAVLLPDTDINGAILTADKIRAAIAEISLPGLDLAITASVGIATYPDHATGPDRLESLADSALYLAKRTGRDRIEVAVPPSDSARIGRTRGIGRRTAGVGSQSLRHCRSGRLTTMASWVLRAMTTTASTSGSGFSSRCGTHGGT